MDLPVRPTGDLAGAEAALEAAAEAFASAEDSLADLEGRIAVLELKAEAAETDESLEPWRKAEARANLAEAERAFRRAGIKLGRAERKLESASLLVDAEHRALAAALAAPVVEEAPPAPRFATVELFVTKFVLPNLVHRYAVTRVRWCEKWWEHAEAITRLEALWEAFEVMRLQPAPSFSTWLRDHFDVHMRTLTDPEGVFYNCDYKKEHHEPQKPWSSVPAPAGMFAVIEAAQVQHSSTSGPSSSAASPAVDQPAVDQPGGGGIAMDAAAARRAETHAGTTTRHHTRGAAR
ncbi:DUF4913 domain-containing protein [Pimelobacter simplex]|uniref:DUF4913 domain-containing protein n=1 Tax=Nocardioides simplex TaxID=2045 RepID=UPI0021504D9A|nr:DUF4913 domain-containing protein [Pimelobacter simplex]UUW93017.1 DUF4913 domain-containing protein [Pimelobacter simplex]UUW99050.1 DUF4913 domain-containing protein [Pimelobacter simplex]